MAIITELARCVLALAIATLLAVRGYRRRSLSFSGAAAAFVVGGCSLCASLRFGGSLIMFYLTSTKATRFRSDIKARVEDGHDGPAGNRGAGQVLASSGPAVFASLVYWYWYRYDSPISSHLPDRSALNLFIMLFFAACSGDTFASELGTVLGGSAEKPFLVTSPRTIVPRGTNGGVTVAGTIASGVGGFVIGWSYYAMGPDWGFDQLALILVGTLGGLIGSFMDSVIGSVLQISLLDLSTKKILKFAPLPEERNGMRLQHVCGRDLLSGEAVNCIAAIFTGALSPIFVRVFF